MSLNKTLIDWVKNPDGTQGYTLNSKTGCLNHTPEGLCLGGMFPCYAYNLANGRLKRRYWLNENLAPTPRDLVNYNLDPFYPRWWPERLRDIPHDWTTLAGRQHVKPRGIFLDDMSDWMGDYWPEEWTEQELQMMRDCSQHRIYTLTKQPQNLIKFSPFPDNCWVGVTVTNKDMLEVACSSMIGVQARVKFLSIEPLLEKLTPSRWLYQPFHWVIIGALTCKAGDILHRGSKYPDLKAMPYGKIWTLQPKIEWVEEIVRACDKAGVPVFLKDNLKPLLLFNPLESLAQPTKITYEMDGILATADIGGSSWGREGDYAVDEGGAKRLRIKEVLDIKLRQELPSGQ